MNLPGISAGLKVGKGLDLSKVTVFGPPAAAIAVSVLVLIFIVWPKLTDALKLRASNTELTARAQSLQAKVDLLSQLDKVDLDQKLSASELLLPSDKSVFSFVRQIEAAAGANGVLLNKIDVAPGALNTDSNTPTGNPAAVAQGSAQSASASSLDSFPKLQVKVSITSNYQSFLGFMKSIFTLSRVVSVTDLAITAGSSESGGAPPLRASMTISAYWKSLPRELGSIESPVQNLTASEEDLLKKVKLEEASAPVSATASAIPSVPTGRSDLFAPY